MFCRKCKSLMYPKNGKLVCKKCLLEKELEISIVTKESPKDRELKIIAEEEHRLEIRSRIKIECPICSNKEAHWSLRQMRGSDEPETRFYTCTKCKHTWRED